LFVKNVIIILEKHEEKNKNEENSILSLFFYVKMPKEKNKLANLTERKLNAWFFSSLDTNRQYNAGDIVDIQIMRVGEWQHQEYGKIKVTSNDLVEVKQNFDSFARRIEIVADENHEPDHKALGVYEELYLSEDGMALFAKIKITKLGSRILSDGAYFYFSPEIAFEYEDEETGEEFTNLLLGGGFTNRPFFKAMKPLMASESSGQALSIYLFTKSKREKMDKFLELINTLNDSESITKDEKNSLESAFNELSDHEKGVKEYKEAYEGIVAKFTDEGGKGEEPKEEEKKDESESDEAEKKEDEKVEEPKEEEEKEEEPKEEEPVDEPKDKEKSEEKVVEASEKVDYKKYSELKAQISKLENENRRFSVVEKVKSFVYSDGNDKGVLLPKEENDVVELAMSLSEKKRDLLWKVLGTRTKLARTSAFKEIGHDGEGAKVTAKETVDKMFGEVKDKVGFGQFIKDLARTNEKLFAEYEKELNQ